MGGLRSRMSQLRESTRKSASNPCWRKANGKIVSIIDVRSETLFTQRNRMSGVRMSTLHVPAITAQCRLGRAISQTRTLPPKSARLVAPSGVIETSIRCPSP